LENQILLALQQINEKLDDQSKKLDEHGEILKHHGEMLKQHSETLKQHGEILKQHGEMLKQHSVILKEHGEILKQHGETLKEHGRILGALRSGQEVLKVELSELRLQMAKEFGELRELFKDHDVSIELLKEEIWSNKKEIRRVQKTMGLV
jgi:hypothetical protein